MAKAKKSEAEAKAAAELRALLLRQTPQAIAFLTALMQDEGQKPELRMKAAESILDRVCGKASAAHHAAQEEKSPTLITFEGVLEEWSR